MRTEKIFMVCFIVIFLSIAVLILRWQSIAKAQNDVCLAHQQEMIDKSHGSDYVHILECYL